MNGIIISLIGILVPLLYYVNNNGQLQSKKKIFFEVILSFFAMLAASACMTFIQKTSGKEYFSSFTMCFFSIGIFEEVTKLILIKIFSEKGNKRDIMLTSIMIGLIMECIENIVLYYNAAERRIIMPGHVVYSMIIGFFLCEASDLKKDGKNSKVILYNICPCVITAFFHTIFDMSWQNITSAEWGTMLVAIYAAIFYIFIFVGMRFIMKYNDENIVPNKLQNVLNVIIISISVIYALYEIFALYSSFFEA